MEKSPTEVVVECNGVGYLVHISLNTYARIGNEEALMLYTHLIVREDAHTLYGFSDKEERELFGMLIAVSGIGASTARTMLSAMEPARIREAVLQEDERSIQSIKGIGAKTAKRLIIDLKDKLAKWHPQSDERTPMTGNTAAEEALSALEVLGFARKSADKVLRDILKNDPGLPVEQLIKLALKNL